MKMAVKRKFTCTTIVPIVFITFAYIGGAFYLYFISILSTSDYLLIDTLITLFDYMACNSACSTHKLGSARRYGI